MKNIVVRLALPIMLISAASVFLAGCQTVQNAYDSTREMLGIQKRDMMISEVKDARHALEEVKFQFQSAMDIFKTVLNSKEGKLEEKYRTLKSENEKTEKKAGDIQKSIDSVTRVAESMFAEWEAELDQYHSENLRSGSELRMQEAKVQNNTFINSIALANMNAAPVLATFSDLVLFSRHNLNSETAEALTVELDAAAEKVSSLSQEIDAAIDEADALVNLLAGSEPAAKPE
jgi:sugar-specific transcriptional regulator TrmB